MWTVLQNEKKKKKQKRANSETSSIIIYYLLFDSPIPTLFLFFLTFFAAER